jgi:multidrug efflux pump
LFVMYILGFSINTLTLLALVIAIGLVVDDAIVVLENIHRHMEEGMDRIHASVKGMREIGFAVVAMTVTLAAVFLPVAFTPGRTGKLFIEFAMTLAAAVTISGITALTLSPMMCSRLIAIQQQVPRWSARIEGWIKALEAGYTRRLDQAVAARKLVLAFAAATFALTIFLFTNLQSELSPSEDRGVIFAIGLAPEGSTIQYSDLYAKQLEKILQSIPEAKWNFVAVGFPLVTQTFSVLGLTPWDDRQRSSQEIIASISPQLFGIAGTLNFAINPASLGQSGRSQPVEFVVQTTESYEDLDGIVAQLLEKMRQNPQLMAPDSDLKLNKPELRVTMDRDKLASLGKWMRLDARLKPCLAGAR